MKPDLNLLAVLDAVARHGSVTAAAKQLSLSQPAVSHALNRLRASVGDPLFTRSGRGLVPTPRATAMILPSRDLLLKARSLLAPQQFNPDRETAVFRIGTSDYAASTLVPWLVCLLGNRAPTVRLECLPVGADTLRQLENGGLDFTFWGTQKPSDPFHHLHLLQEHYIGAARSGHPLFARHPRGPVKLAAFLDYAHIVVSLRDPGSNAIDEALARLGKTRRIGMASHSFAGNLTSLRHSNFIASLPSRLCQALTLTGLRTFDLPFDVPSYGYGLVWHQRTEASPAHRWLRGLIADAASMGESRKGKQVRRPAKRAMRAGRA